MKKEKILLILPIIGAVATVAATLTFVLTLIRTGFNEDFLFSWIKAFLPVVFIIAPLGMVSTFVLDKLVSLLFGNFNDLTRKIILAIMMGLFIEFIVSLITMLTSGNYENFLINWMILYIKSVPLGFVVGLFMSFVFKPWMSKRVEKMKNLSLQIS